MGRAVVFWNSYTMNVLARRDGHVANVRHCIVDDRSDRVITISADKAVRCWDSATFRCIQVWRVLVDASFMDSGFTRLTNNNIR